MNLPPTTSSADCDRYWDDADWLPPWFILDRWCQQDAPCRHAKQQALLSACERGEVHYQRRDGKTFDDPVHELLARGLLLIERASFDAWATKLDGKSPLQNDQPVGSFAKDGRTRSHREWEYPAISTTRQFIKRRHRLD